ncbi:PIG-L family deacetylase [Erythrobacter sp. CCH5-A1]|jgi:LmbE family N-acetylglucosaminyl deacetylase|uniref:PIG-L family deacetylase n=1 Tax=Erythrobacter sp. CCH5-A1 TaxID=1768792 RepID=UPI000834BB40|nr:PIG-L family deacetylase [Erythrobacter sp. CCH5-A1]
MIRSTTVAAVLAALAASPAAAKAEPTQNVLVVVAHPDDELFMAPAIAALARQGAKVTIIFATVGDQGPGVTDFARGAQLGAIRRAEAQCSANALGAQARFLEGLGDGTLAETPQAPKSPALRFIDQFAKAYVETDPQLVLTWGPDGGYGHADHRMVSAQVTMALQSLANQYRARLLYVGIPAGSLPKVPQMAGWAETDPALLTEAVRYTPADLAAAKAAAMCHATQFDEASRQGMMGLFDATMWRGKVHFRPAF